MKLSEPRVCLESVSLTGTVKVKAFMPGDYEEVYLSKVNEVKSGKR